MKRNHTKELAERQISRQEFLGISAGAAASIALAGSGMAPFLSREAQAATPALTPFFDALPIPPVLDGTSLSLAIEQTTHQFHTDLPSVDVWGYNGGDKTSGYLGPTIVAAKGTPIQVTYTNNLPTTHLFGIDTNLVQMKGKSGDARTLTHLHGGHISDTADGNPYASNDYKTSQKQTVSYANDQEAAHIWYHDHAQGITRLNVMAGLAGNYLVRDSVDDGQGGNFISGGKLPSGNYEIPLVIQDRFLNADGTLSYPPPPWQPEFFGDTVLVNGKVWPSHEVEPRKYRFRILNGSNSRFYNLALSTKQNITQIGTDGGFLYKPVVGKSVLLAPGERADVVIDFATLQNKNVDLIDTALPKTTVSPATPLAQKEIMRFKVGSGTVTNDVTLPTQLRSTAFSVSGTVAQERFLTLEERLDANGAPLEVLLNGMHFADRVTEQPKKGTTEIWNFINLSADTHPIHLHLVQFEVLERLTLDVAKYQKALDAARAKAGGPVDKNGQLVNPDPGPYTKKGPAVDPSEKGPKDTVRANPEQVTRIKANFDLAGKYVWHCHILEHEDNDMMRPYRVE